MWIATYNINQCKFYMNIIIRQLYRQFKFLRENNIVVVFIRNIFVYGMFFEIVRAY